MDELADPFYFRRDIGPGSTLAVGFKEIGQQGENFLVGISQSALAVDYKNARFPPFLYQFEELFHEGISLRRGKSK